MATVLLSYCKYAFHRETNDLSFHLGISKAMQATIMINLVDYLGDIVFSEANNPAEFPFPNLDDDAAVYAAAMDILDEAKGYLNGATLGTATDLYYGGNERSIVAGEYYYLYPSEATSVQKTQTIDGIIHAANLVQKLIQNVVLVQPSVTKLSIWNTIRNNRTLIQKEVDTIQKGLAHRPFNPNSEQHTQFLSDLQKKITLLKNNFNISF